jgi:hypothetical protein
MVQPRRLVRIIQVGLFALLSVPIPLCLLHYAAYARWPTFSEAIVLLILFLACLGIGFGIRFILSLIPKRFR